MALYAGGKVILVMAGRVALLHIGLGDLAGRDYRQGMYPMARAADGDGAIAIIGANRWRTDGNCDWGKPVRCCSWQGPISVDSDTYFPYPIHNRNHYLKRG